MGTSVLVDKLQYEALLQENRALQRDNRYLRLLTTCSHSVASNVLVQLDLLKTTVQSLLLERPPASEAGNPRDLLPAIVLERPVCGIKRASDVPRQGNMAEAYDLMKLWKTLYRILTCLKRRVAQGRSAKASRNLA